MSERRRPALVLAAFVLAACGGEGGGGPTTPLHACDAPPPTLEHTPGTPNDAIVHVVDVAAHPDALCNDGTPASYVFRPGFGAGARRWVIYLEGGGECATGAACQQRWNATSYWMSSSGDDEGEVFPTALGGIKSTDPSIDPDFHDANLLQLRYCSSDLWSGDVGGDATNVPIDQMGHWHFRGRAIVEAVMQEAQALGLRDAREVLLSGSSAGGIGTVLRADHIRSHVPNAARFVALADAGFFIDYPSYDASTGMESTTIPSAVATELANGVMAWGGGGDEDCETNAGDVVARVACRSVYDTLHAGYVSAPTFIRNSLYDAVQMKRLIPANVPAPAYRMRFAAAMVSRLASLTGVGEFVTSNKVHGVVNDDALFTAATTMDSATLPATVGAWYRDPCGAPTVHVDAP